MKDNKIKFNSGTVTASLRTSERVLLKDVCFCVQKGESLALIGETGSGKTMTALDMMGLLPSNVRAEGRSFCFFGEDISAKTPVEMIGRDIVYIPQNGADYLNPSRRIGKQLKDSGGGLEELRLAGLDDPQEASKKYPFQLSGGQNQRVTIALALCANPRLLIADEPTNGLDAKNKKYFLDSLNNLFPDAVKIIITHDISVAEYCKKILVLRAGGIVETGLSKDVLAAPETEYTRALLNVLAESGMDHAS